MTEDVFTPTVVAPVERDRPPWHLASLIYPAAFGGALTATVLGLLNGYRLAVRPARQIAVVLAGTVGIAARIALLAAPSGGRYPLAAAVGAGTGMLVWLVVNRVQLRAERAFLLRGRTPGGLFRPGLVAMLACAPVEWLLGIAVTQLVLR